MLLSRGCDHTVTESRTPSLRRQRTPCTRAALAVGFQHGAQIRLSCGPCAKRTHTEMAPSSPPSTHLIPVASESKSVGLVNHHSVHGSTLHRAVGVLAVVALWLTVALALYWCCRRGNEYRSFSVDSRKSRRNRRSSRKRSPKSSPGLARCLSLGEQPLSPIREVEDEYGSPRGLKASTEGFGFCNSHKEASSAQLPPPYAEHVLAACDAANHAVDIDDWDDDDGGSELSSVVSSAPLMSSHG